MSRSRKKVSHSYICVVNHCAESKHFTMKRRIYRRTSKQHLRNKWMDEDLLIPIHKPMFKNYWDMPSDGSWCAFYPPKPNNPFKWRYGRLLEDRSNPTEQELLKLAIDALESDAEDIERYYKDMRK